LVLEDVKERLGKQEDHQAAGPDACQRKLFPRYDCLILLCC